MALWFITDDGREVHKPPYTKAEQMAIYKSMADGPKVIVKHSVPHLEKLPHPELLPQQQPEEQNRS